MHVLEWAGERGTVVIAHGVTGTAFDHTPLARYLNAAGYRVLVPDAPGCGRSDSPQDRELGFGLRAMARDYGQLLDSLATGPVHWIGASKGGGLGIQLGGEAPGRLRSLTLYDVGITLPDAVIAGLGQRLAEPPRLPSLAAFRDHVARFFERSRHQLSGERLDEIAVAWSRRCDDGAVSYHYDPGLAAQFRNCPEDFALWPQWEGIACPVLILRGADSHVFPASEAQEMRERNPRATVEEVADAGHVNMLDAANLQERITQFINDSHQQ